MIFKNTMQLKALIKNKAEEKNIPAQLLLQNYVMERFLERISKSTYKKNFIVKGGFLIAAIVGIDNRTTMDLDATLKGMPLSEKSLKEMFEKICKIKVADGFAFSIKRLEAIRESDEYQGWRVYLSANYEVMEVPLSVDITTGDKITPKAINYKFKLLLDNRSLSLMSYNTETILAEKIETILSRNVVNTRPRDFYDVYKIVLLQEDEIDFETLKKALENTAKKRNSLQSLKNYKTILNDIQNSPQMQKFWDGYSKSNAYADGISFDNVCKTLNKLMQNLIRMETQLP